MKGWKSIVVSIGILMGIACKKEDQTGPSTLAPVQMAPVVNTVKTTDEGDPLAGLRSGARYRQGGREKTGVENSGSIHQKDSLLVLVRCEGGDIRVALDVGNTDRPYLDADGLVKLAKTVSERALSTDLGSEFIACDALEASYWARDAQGQADFVVRYPVAATAAWSLWFVPDVGEPTRITKEKIPSRVFVGQLIRVAHYLGEYKGSISEAFVVLDNVFQLDPGNLDALALYVEWMVDLNPEMALKRVLRFEGEQGVSNRTKVLHAQVLFQMGRVEEAAEGDRLIAEVLKEDPSHLEGRFHAAHRLLEKGNPEGALMAFRSLLEEHPNLGMIRCTLGDLLVQTGEKDAALVELNGCLEFDGDDGSARIARARLLLSMGKKEEARQDLKALKRLAPDDPEVSRLEDLLKP